MCLQFGILSRLTWCEYSWDIIEPVTYFIGYGTLMGMFAYYIVTRQVNTVTTHDVLYDDQAHGVLLCRSMSIMMQGTGSI